MKEENRLYCIKIGHRTSRRRRYDPTFYKLLKTRNMGSSATTTTIHHIFNRLFFRVVDGHCNCDVYG